MKFLIHVVYTTCLLRFFQHTLTKQQYVRCFFSSPFFQSVFFPMFCCNHIVDIVYVVVVTSVYFCFLFFYFCSFARGMKQEQEFSCEFLFMMLLFPRQHILLFSYIHRKLRFHLFCSLSLRLLRFLFFLKNHFCNTRQQKVFCNNTNEHHQCFELCRQIVKTLERRMHWAWALFETN